MFLSVCVIFIKINNGEKTIKINSILIKNVIIGLK